MSPHMSGIGFNGLLTLYQDTLDDGLQSSQEIIVAVRRRKTFLKKYMR